MTNEDQDWLQNLVRYADLTLRREGWLWDTYTDLPITKTWTLDDLRNMADKAKENDLYPPDWDIDTTTNPYWNNYDDLG